MDVSADSIVLTARKEIGKPVKIGFANKPYYKVGIVNSEDIPLLPFSKQVT